MKSLIKGFIALIIFVLLIVCLLFIVLSSSSSGEVKGITDQLNPFVKEKDSYVKTKKPDAVKEHNIRSYDQEIVDAEGNRTKVNYISADELKINRYLKIKHKGTHVESFEEVTRDQVPEKALQVID
nr:YxeA family protein [Mammaliicoccus sp. Marseille-Q6498]